jgi:hypothetical protein
MLPCLKMCGEAGFKSKHPEVQVRSTMLAGSLKVDSKPLTDIFVHYEAPVNLQKLAEIWIETRIEPALVTHGARNPICGIRMVRENDEWRRSPYSCLLPLLVQEFTRATFSD